MKKFSLVFLSVVVSCLLTACGGKESAPIDGNSISLGKKGDVNEVIRESFTESYYNIDELSDMITNEVNSFNASHGKDSICIEKVALSQDQSTTDVSLIYDNFELFNVYNGYELFYGKCKDVENASLPIDVTLSSIKDATKTITGNDISKEKNNILITDYDGTVCLNGKVLYISDNCNVSKDLSTVSRKPESEEYIYVIYK